MCINDRSERKKMLKSRIPLVIAGHTGIRKLDISYPVGEFTRMAKQWDGFVHEKMGIVVRHIKKFVSLPFLSCCGVFETLCTGRG